MTGTIYTCPEPSCQRRFQQAPAYDRHLKKHINDGHYLADVTPAGLRKAKRAALGEGSTTRKRRRSAVPHLQSTPRATRGNQVVPVRHRRPNASTAVPRRKRAREAGPTDRGGSKKRQAEAREELRRQQKRRKRVFMKIASGQVGSSASASGSKKGKGKTAIVDLRTPSPPPDPEPEREAVLSDQPPGPLPLRPQPRACRASFPLSPDPTTRLPSSAVETDTDVSPLLPSLPIPPVSPTGPKWATRPLTPLPLDPTGQDLAQEEDELEEEEDELDWDEPTGSQQPAESLPGGNGNDTESLDLDAESSVVSTTSAATSSTGIQLGDTETSSIELVDAMVFGYRLPSGTAQGRPSTPERSSPPPQTPPKAVSPFKGLTPRHRRPEWPTPIRQRRLPRNVEIDQ